jgi:hypothetical protein
MLRDTRIVRDKRRDVAPATASVKMRWRNGWSAGAAFEGEFSNVTRS